ncbi:formyl transferase [Mesorhizobium sp. BAC0120]|uniref:formyl transferase n=1 Tax=Mesorhizobium sp. BAC0120 TaxID=3090670 RepID=UPI00298C1D08|nr:formyl transferase [Mesorhizobium sp. BAC0120]MDW6026049.1 formyl transferase [Mesorhizobium sp. BAC0120]
MQSKAHAGICVVTAGGPYPWIIINALGKEFGPIDVILEEPEPRGMFLKRRARKIGWFATAGQFGTMVLVRLGKKRFATRIARIVQENGLEEEPGPEHRVTEIGSINSDDFLKAVERLGPKVILLVGCRIAKPAILASLKMPVLNYHAGITPQYRGMNCGYWALAAGDKGNFGGTVHLVDKGVDTGAILYQARGLPAPDDNLMTYTHRIAAISRDICISGVRDALEGKLRPVAASGPSRQYYHPTVWQYLWTGLTRGVW